MADDKGKIGKQGRNHVASVDHYETRDIARLTASSAVGEIGAAFFYACRLSRCRRARRLAARAARMRPPSTAPGLADRVAVCLELRVVAAIGVSLQMAFMAELRERHLGIRNPIQSPPVSEGLQAAYEAAVANAKRQDR
jgi:hypothetical protein